MSSLDIRLRRPMFVFGTLARETRGNEARILMEIHFMSSCFAIKAREIFWILMNGRDAR